MQCGLMLKTRGPLILQGSLESVVFDALLCTTQTAVLIISVFAAVALFRKNTKKKVKKMKKRLSAVKEKKKNPSKRTNITPVEGEKTN